MTASPDELLDRIRSLKVWKSGSQRAPHKPLLLLLALGRLQRSEARYVRFADIDEDFQRLLRDFGPPRKSYHPEFPFHHLRSDGLWEFDRDYDLRLREGRSSPTKRALLDQGVAGGLPTEVEQTLRAHPELLVTAARELLDGHFPTSLHDDIATAVGLDLDATALVQKPAVRDPDFRVNVLRAYSYRCSVCGFDVRLDDRTVGIEAAHIQWHQAGGPATVDNGLALCALHHKLFDRGAFTVGSDDYQIRISDLGSGGEGFRRWLLDFEKQTIAAPVREDMRPKATFLEWHQGEVFRGQMRQHHAGQHRLRKGLQP